MNEVTTDADVRAICRQWAWKYNEELKALFPDADDHRRFVLRESLKALRELAKT